MSETPPKLDRATLVAAVVLALPPLFALVAGLFPGTVPVPFVQMPDGGGVRPLLLLLALLMAALNAAVLYGLHRMVRQ